MTIDFSDLDKVTNKKYRKYYDDSRRFQIYKGGAGAGKSVFCAQKIVYNSLVNAGYNGLILRNTGRDNHDSTFSELRKCIAMFGMQDLFEVNRSRGAEEITCKLNHNKMIFRGLDDVEKVKSVTFETGDLVFIWCEEASEIAEADFNQLNLRLRGTGDITKHIMLSFNPIDAGHWIKSRFFDIPLDAKDGFICESTFHDNVFLDDAYKAELEKLKDVDYYCYQVYVLNQWGSRTGAQVFNNLQIHDFEVIEYNMSNIRHGLDFGYNHANAYIRCGYKDGELWIWREHYAKRQLNKDFIKSVEEQHADKGYRMTADSADPDKIAEFNQYGFLVDPARKGPDSLRRGVDYLKSLGAIHIHKSNCPNTAREFARFKYKEIKSGIILDTVVEIDDDTIAAVRYAIEDMIASESADGKRHFFMRR